MGDSISEGAALRLKGRISALLGLEDTDAAAAEAADKEEEAAFCVVESLAVTTEATEGDDRAELAAFALACGGGFSRSNGREIGGSAVLDMSLGPSSRVQE
jgi:hypothetical protein